MKGLRSFDTTNKSRQERLLVAVDLLTRVQLLSNVGYSKIVAGNTEFMTEISDKKTELSLNYLLNFSSASSILVIH